MYDPLSWTVEAKGEQEMQAKGIATNQEVTEEKGVEELPEVSVKPRRNLRFNNPVAIPPSMDEQMM